jgi:hypothetical protein
VRLKENRVLRKLCGRKRVEGVEVSEHCRTRGFVICAPLLCYWGNKIKEMERGGVLFDKSEGKGSLRRLRT